MGVSIKEILQSKFFQDYYIIAGGQGLAREAQAVVLFDAPDGYRWLKGNEFVISSGYFLRIMWSALKILYALPIREVWQP